MKRLIALLLAFAMSFALAACSSFGYFTNARDPSTGGSGSAGPGEETPGEGDLPPIDPELEGMYTVTCSFNNQIFTSLAGSSAMWTGMDGSVYLAPFNDEGIAVCAESEEMDGDYYISLDLVGLATYTYKPDAYMATANSRHVNVVLRSCTPLTTRTIVAPTNLQNGRVYSAELTTNSTNEDGAKFFILGSASQVETWCSTREDRINPRITGMLYVSGSGYTNPNVNVICDSGGTAGLFTHNVKLSFALYPELNDKGVNRFRLTASERSGAKVQTTIYFEVTSTTNAPGTDPATMTYERVQIKDPSLLRVVEPATTDWKYVYEDTKYRENGIDYGVLRNSDFKLFAKGTTDSAGNKGDGYYHRYDAANDVYGEIVFAMITHDCEILETEGTNSGFRYNKIYVRANGRDYTDFFGEINPTSGLRGWKEGEAHNTNGADPPLLGYALYANSVGAHPVTEEFRQFLLDFAAGDLFNDGRGTAEDGTLGENMRLLSGEEDMWLFCCFYYPGFTQLPEEA